MSLRRNIILVALALGLCGLWTALVHAGTATVTYTEPTVTVSGTPLTNLTETHIYWKQDAGAEAKVVVPASKPQGGGAITQTATYVSPGPCASTIVSVQATAFNTIESVRTPIMTSTKNGTPPPGDPACTTPALPGSVTLSLGP